MSLYVFRFAFLIISHPVLGKWKQGEPSRCARKCGVGAGKSGTPGAVTCSTASCDLSAKPAAKQCLKTVDCGAFDTDMPIVNSHSHTTFSCTIITRSHHKLPPINQHMNSRFFFFFPILTRQSRSLFIIVFAIGFSWLFHIHAIRQLGATSANRMCQKMWSGSRKIGKPGRSDLQHDQL